MHHPDGIAPEPATPPGRSTWRRTLVGGTIAYALLFRWISLGIDHPSVVYDENGYLGNARTIAGGARWEMPFAPAYAIGYPTVLAPFLRLIDGAPGQWQAVLAVNACLLALVFPLLALVLHRVLGFGRRAAIGGAIVGTLAPAVVAAGISGIAENLALPTILATVLACWSFARPGPWFRRIWFGPLVVVLYATHARFTGVLLLAAIALAWVAWRDHRARRVAAANLAGLVVGAAAVGVATQAMIDARWPAVERLEGRPSDWAAILTSAEGLVDAFHEAIGQAWYLAAGSAGLGVIGVVIVARHLRPNTRGGGAASEAGTGVDPRSVALAFVAVAATMVFGTSVLFFTQNQFRADHLVYGRHNDSFVTLWSATGIAFLVQTRSRRKALVALAGAAAVVAVLGVLLMIVRDPGRYGGYYSPFAVPAVFRFVANHPPQTFWKSTLGALAILGAITAITALRFAPAATRRRWVAPALVIALVAVPGMWGFDAGRRVALGTRVFQDRLYAEWRAPADLRRLGVDQLDIDGRIAGGFANLAYPWHLPEVEVSTYDSGAGDVPDGPYVVAAADDPDRVRAGARILLLDEGFTSFIYPLPHGLAVWVERGPDQDRLAAAGRLLPEGFPTDLPRSSRAVVLRVEGGQQARTVRSGDAVRVAVRGRSTGSGSPWPNKDSFNRPGRVRVIAEVTPLEPGDPVGAASGGELPRWTLPGDRFATVADVFAVDQFLQPLPPGRYAVQLGVGQDPMTPPPGTGGPTWFASGGPSARFTLVVSPR